MKKISAEIVADSISPQGHRITSYILTYPRFIHAELMTHRMFSRNSASSRAIPFEKMVKMVEEDPFIPIAWQKDHRGMQGGEYLSEDNSRLRTKQWLLARDSAVEWSTALNSKLETFGGDLIDSGNTVTKQLCNRLLEPFMWHTVLVTATEWDNFFELRCPQYEFEDLKFKSKKDYLKYWDTSSQSEDALPPIGLDWYYINKSGAEIHIQALAEAMWDAMKESTPNQLKAGEWHIPFGDKIDLPMLYFYSNDGDHQSETELNKAIALNKLKVAVARCARLSYMTFDGEIDYEKDIKLHDQLLENKHLSPFEHVARCMNEYEFHNFTRGFPAKDGIGSFVQTGWCNNFRGFIPYRYMVENGD